MTIASTIVLLALFTILFSIVNILLKSYKMKTISLADNITLSCGIVSMIGLVIHIIAHYY